MKINAAELERLALAAIPGPSHNGYETRDFIAAANPMTVLKLIEALRQAKECLQTYAADRVVQYRTTPDGTMLIDADGTGDPARKTLRSIAYHFNGL